jgi:hypothetical protein
VQLLLLLNFFCLRTSHKGCLKWGVLGINSWGGDDQRGDWAIQVAIMYNRQLQISEVLAMESWILSMQGAFSPAHLQVNLTVSCSKKK